MSLVNSLEARTKRVVRAVDVVDAKVDVVEIVVIGVGEAAIKIRTNLTLKKTMIARLVS
jgi:hypothetical protein